MFDYGFTVLAFWGVFAISASIVAYLEDQAGVVHVAGGAVLGSGTYAAAILVSRYGVPLLLAIVGALVVGSIFGAAIHLVTLRLAGDSLALATLAVAVVFHGLALNLNRLTNGPMGIAGLPAWRALLWRPIIDLAVLLGLTLAAIRWIPCTVFGKRVCALRDDEELALVLGLDPRRVRFMLWVLSSAVLAGVGGIYAFLLRFVDPSSFSPSISFELLAMALAIRLPLHWRGAAGALVFVLLPEGLRQLAVAPALASQLRQLLFAFALMWVAARVVRRTRVSDIERQVG